MGRDHSLHGILAYITFMLTIFLTSPHPYQAASLKSILDGDSRQAFDFLNQDATMLDTLVPPSKRQKLELVGSPTEARVEEVRA